MEKKHLTETIFTLILLCFFLMAFICLLISPMLLVFLIEDEFTLTEFFKAIFYFFVVTFLYNSFVVLPVSWLIKKKWWLVETTVLFTIIVTGLMTYFIKSPFNHNIRLVCIYSLATFWLAGMYKVTNKAVIIFGKTFKQIKFI